MNRIHKKFEAYLILIFVVFVALSYLQFMQAMPALFALAISILLFSLTLVAVFFIMNKSIVNPMKNLEKVANDIRMGNLHTKVDIKSSDEIGHLADAFNELIINLKKSREKIEKLEAHSKELDKEAYRRSEELNTKIEDLTKMKTAILNMMEDTDETNVKLLVSREKLKKSLAELKELDVRKDQFISVAAHELKTPITAIRGFSDLLQTESVGNDPDRRNKFLSIINTEILRLGNLVDDILDLSRIDIGKIILSIEEVDINELMERVKGMTNIIVKSRDLEYNFEAQENLPHIMSDKERLEQVLINLINNAVKYTDKGSISVSTYKDGNSIHFTVKDTGVGILKNDLKKIFERFYQVGSHLTRKVGGAGLGLAICEEIVKLMDGSIWAESEVDKGSTFHVTLPISKPKQKAI